MFAKLLLCSGGLSRIAGVAGLRRASLLVLSLLCLMCSNVGGDSPSVDAPASIGQRLGACPPIVDGSEVTGRHQRLALSAPRVEPAAIVRGAESSSGALIEVTATVSDKPGVAHGPFNYFVRYNVAIQDASCTPIRTLASELAAPAPGAYVLSAAWDGVDQAGDPVPAGEYFVQVQATYLKRHSGNGHE